MQVSNDHHIAMMVMEDMMMMTKMMMMILVIFTKMVKRMKTWKTMTVMLEDGIHHHRGARSSGQRTKPQRRKNRANRSPRTKLDL